MPQRYKIALVGDHDPSRVAHVCAPKALEIAAHSMGVRIDPVWWETSQLTDHDPRLEGLSGIWCVPGSPYKDRKAVLDLIYTARTSNIPYLGTCGGCHHAVLEFARNQLGIKNAGFEEEEAGVEVPLISALSCRLTDESQKITLVPDSKLGRAFSKTEISEEYRCGFGINPRFQSLFTKSALRFVAFNDEMVPQAVELIDHPFFIGTAFQPERSARSGASHPLIAAFLRAATSIREKS